MATLLAQPPEDQPERPARFHYFTPKPQPPARRWPGMARLLYNHNPFYLVSGCLMLYGLRQAFRVESGELLDPWALMASLCGYTLAAAAAAFLIVRLGRVWEDARSLVLILLLMFLAVSVSFDEIVISDPHAGRALLLFGFCFSVAISEGLLGGLGIRLPMLFRGPFYLLLGLFFAYPLWVSPEMTGLPSELLRWRILLFPTAAALPILALIPAARRGSRYVADNGTPWRWPLFPWTLFLFLGVAVCLRSYLLAISFDPVHGIESRFGPYVLVPFLLAVLAVLLEIGLRQRSRGLQRAVMLLVPGLLVLAVSGVRADGGAWLDLTGGVVSPLFLTAGGVTAFYLLAWLRQVPLAEAGCIGGLLAWSALRPWQTGFGPEVAPQFWAVQAAGLLALVVGLRRKDSRRTLLGLTLCAVASGLGAESVLPSELRYLVPAHLWLAGLLVIGVSFDDAFAARVRRAAGLLLAVAALLAVAGSPAEFGSPPLRLTYATGLAVLSYGYWRLSRERWQLAACLACLTAAVGSAAAWGWGGLQDRLDPQTLFVLTAGVASFALAIVISAIKGGGTAWLRRHWRAMWNGPTRSLMG